MVLRCAWGTCRADERYPERLAGEIFIPFPKPKTQLAKCLRWIEACGRPELSVARINKHNTVCSKHFVGGCGPTAFFPDPLPALNAPDPLDDRGRHEEESLSEVAGLIELRGGKLHVPGSATRPPEEVPLLFACVTCHQGFVTPLELVCHVRSRRCAATSDAAVLSHEDTIYVEPPRKRGRGRPKGSTISDERPINRKRGRPRKLHPEIDVVNYSHSDCGSSCDNVKVDDYGVYDNATVDNHTHATITTETGESEAITIQQVFSHDEADTSDSIWCEIVDSRGNTTAQDMVSYEPCQSVGMSPALSRSEDTIQCTEKSDVASNKFMEHAEVDYIDDGAVKSEEDWSLSSESPSSCIGRGKKSGCVEFVNSSRPLEPAPVALIKSKGATRTRGDFKCSQCLKRFFHTEEERTLHESCHFPLGGMSGKQSYKCTMCTFQTQWWDKCVYHLASHQEIRTDFSSSPLFQNAIGDFPCYVCNKRFEKKMNLYWHFNHVHHHTQRKTQCANCYRVIQGDERQFRRHREKCQGLVFHCKLCPYKTTGQHNLRGHMKVHNDTGHTCDVCKAGFPTRQRLNIHREKHKSRAERQLYMCESCTATFVTIGALTRHVARRHDNLPAAFSCTLCDFRCQLEPDLKKHVKGVHDKLFKCDSCSYQTNSRDTMARHALSRRHHERLERMEEGQYYSSLDDCKDAVKALGLETHTSYSILSMEKNIGKEWLPSTVKTIHWQSCTEALKVAYDGIPYVCVEKGRLRWQCHQGSDKNAYKDKKSNSVAKKHGSKKVGCEYVITATELIKFPNQKHKGDKLPTHREIAAIRAAINVALSDGSAVVHRRFVMHFPSMDGHSGHSLLPEDNCVMVVEQLESDMSAQPAAIAAVQTSKD